MKRTLSLFAAALILTAVILLIPFPQVRYGAGFVLLWLLPGLIWINFLSPASFDTLERVMVGLGLSYVITLPVVLLAVYLPGALTRELLLFLMMVVMGLPVLGQFIRQKRGMASESPSAATDAGLWWQQAWFWLLVVLLVAAAVRLLNLNYAEFQGDEGAVLVRAARILTGEDGVIFQHKKGPAELLIVMANWSLAGITSEWMARLSFAWASLLGVAGVFLFGRRLRGLPVAVIAGLLVAIEGYLVGFGRIVQYQSVVFALSTLGLFCLLLYAKQGRGLLVWLAAAFFAVGAWAHYDAMLALPAGLLLLASRLWQDRAQWRRWLLPVVGAGVLGVILLALFYLPFGRSPEAGNTAFYLGNRLGSDQTFFNHLISAFERTAVYNSIYFMALIVFGLAAQTLFAWRRWSRVGLVLAAVLLLAVSTTLAKPEWWEFGELTMAWLPATLWIIGSLLIPRQKMGTRAVWLWFGVPFLFYSFFVAQPLTHIYTAVPGAAMLAGLGFVYVGEWLAGYSKTAVRVAVVVGLGVYALGLFYVNIMFVDHTPEYRRNYPEMKNPLFWTPYGDEMPKEGLFGFPYRAGWKTVGYLLESGELSGSYDSNEERDVTDFYTRQAMRLNCATPDMYVTAVNVQDEVPIRYDQIEADYAPNAIVTVAGKPKITVYQRHYAGEPQTYAAEDYDWLYDLGSTPAKMSVQTPAITGDAPTGFTPINGQIGDFAHLIGYQIDTTYAQPGGYVDLTLLWETLGSAPIDYQLFTHLHDGENMRGQLDGQPMCSSAPTSKWLSDQYVIDPYRIPIQPEAALGSVPLTVGMYNLATLQRLPSFAADGTQIGDTIHITDVEIQSGE